MVLFVRALVLQWLNKAIPLIDLLERLCNEIYWAVVMRFINISYLTVTKHKYSHNFTMQQHDEYLSWSEEKTGFLLIVIYRNEACCWFLTTSCLSLLSHTLTHSFPMLLSAVVNWDISCFHYVASSIQQQRDNATHHHHHLPPSLPCPLRSISLSRLSATTITNVWTPWELLLLSF